MSRKTVIFLRKFEQARGNNNTIEYGSLVRVPIRSAEAAFNIILPENIKGDKVLALAKVAATVERF